MLLIYVVWVRGLCIVYNPFNKQPFAVAQTFVQDTLCGAKSCTELCNVIILAEILLSTIIYIFVLLLNIC